jgi:hypothetical protein
MGHCGLDSILGSYFLRIDFSPLITRFKIPAQDILECRYAMQIYLLRWAE